MEENIKKRALQGAAFVIAGYGLSQVLRLGGNIVLTRLLVPEFFGIMALARAFMTGLHFFSDVGLGPGIIRSSRGNDSVFLNTAWTIQVVRGLVLSLFALALAAPMANIYDSPILIWVFPIVGLNAIFYGFNATSIYTLNKDIRQGKLAVMEFFSQVIALICMIILAYLYKNIWSLVIGNMVGVLVTTIWSHFLESTTRNHFALEKDAVKELFSFGKWIFISTAMMFLATQADRFLLGKFFPLALFGVYNIAIIFAELPKQVINQVSNKVIYPVISKFSHLPRNELRSIILRKRQFMLLPLALLVALLGSFGDILIDFLYDDRYRQAGWMLTMLAFGMWPLVLYATMGKCLYVVGKPNYSANGNFLKFLYMIIFIPLSFKYAGLPGAVITVALNDFPVYVVINYGLFKEKFSCFRQDLLATVILAVFVGFFIAIRIYFEMGIPGRALL